MSPLAGFLSLAAIGGSHCGEGKSSCYYCLYDPTDYDSFNLTIYRSSFRGNAHFSPRWWSFVRFFNGENEVAESVNEFRCETKNETLLLHGNSAFYIDDQGVSASVDGIAEYSTWNAVVEYVQTNFAGQILNISEWMKTKVSNKTEWKIFFDDFKDIN